MFKTVRFGSFLAVLLVSKAGVAASDFIQGHIGGLSNQVSDRVGNVPGNRYNGEFEFDYNRNVNNTIRTELEGRFHVASRVNDQSLTMYSLQEAYIGSKFDDVAHVRVGRSILPWSDVDKIWGFGKLNNRRNFDYFTPGQEGLIGALGEISLPGGFRGKLFLSGLYVPETNPSLDIDKKKGTIKSRHPWADVPANRAVVEGVNMDVKYNVDYPEINDVIYRASGGASVGYEDKHWESNFFFMRKPENSTTPQVDVNVDFVGKVVNADITPKFYYHDLYGTTLKYKNIDYEMYFSAIAIRPNTIPDVDEKVKYTEIKNKKRREDYAGVGVSKSNDLYTMALNYVARLSPFDRLKDDLAQDPRWNQAVNILLSRNFGRHYTLSTDAKYDMLTNDRLVMFQAGYMPTKDLMVNVGVNLIGTPNNGKSYWSPYTNNDAIYGGMRYVF